MRLRSRIAAALLAVAALPAAAYAAMIGGTYYALQYDYREFFAATDGKTFQVVLARQSLSRLPIRRSWRATCCR